MTTTKLAAQILYGKDYWEQLNDTEKRAIIFNDMDCRIESDEIEGDNEYLEDN